MTLLIVHGRPRIGFWVFWGSRQLSPFLGEGGPAGGLYRPPPPPPRKRKPGLPCHPIAGGGGGGGSSDVGNDAASSFWKCTPRMFDIVSLHNL